MDLTVARLVSGGAGDVNPETKRALAAVLTLDMRTKAGVTPLSTCLERLAGSLAVSSPTLAAE